MWIGLGTVGSPRFGLPEGIRAEVGYQLHQWALDARLGIARIPYSRRSVAVDPSSRYDLENSPAGFETDSEINRPRADSDPWQTFNYELGFSFLTQPFPKSIPQLMERSRVAYGTGNWKDETNNLGFSPRLFVAEAELQYRFSANDRFVAQAGVSWHVGSVTAVGARSDSAGLLPVSWLEFSCGLNMLLY
jgi:hypothetical protein